MRKQMIENAAYEVATQVRAVEDSIEAALVEIAELQTKMVHARVVTRAGFVTATRRSSSSPRRPPAWSPPAAGSPIATRRWPRPASRSRACADRRFGDVDECPQGERRRPAHRRLKGIDRATRLLCPVTP